MDAPKPITSGMPPVNQTESPSVPGSASGHTSTPPVETALLDRRTLPSGSSQRPRSPVTFNLAGDESRDLRSRSPSPDGETPSRETPEFLQDLKGEQAVELAALRRPPVNSTSVALTAYVMNAQAIGDTLTAKEQELFAEGEKMASATKALLPDGQANVTDNLKNKDCFRRLASPARGQFVTS